MVADVELRVINVPLCLLLEESILETTLCCCEFVLSYTLKASSDLWPVLSWITFSGTPVSYMRVTEVARMLWLVTLPSIPANAHIFLSLFSNVFFPIGIPLYHGVAEWFWIISKVSQTQYHSQLFVEVTCWSICWKWELDNAREEQLCFLGVSSYMFHCLSWTHALCIHIDQDHCVAWSETI